MKEIKNIFIVNGNNGYYRTQTIVRALFDLNYKISILNFSLNTNFNKSFWGSFFPRLKNRFRILFLNLTKFYLILITDLVIIPAMNPDLFSLKIARFFRKKVLYDFYISYYDTFVKDRAIFKIFSKQASYYLNLDRKLVKNSTMLFFLNNSEREYYLELINYKVPINSVILPLVVEQRAQARLDYFDHINNQKIFNIVWWGTYIPLHGLENVILAIKELIKVNENIHLYIYGDDKAKSIPFQNLVKAELLGEFISFYSNITFLDGQLEDVLIKNGHLAIGSFGSSVKAKTVITNKLLDAVTMQIPVITQPSKGVYEYFSENEIFFSSNNPKSIALKIIDIMKMDREKILSMTSNALEVYKKEFSYSVFKNKLSEYLNLL
jgi:glycosyltransferase involved in cell wall biosynthesis